MPAGREAEFQAGFSKFYDATKVHIDTVSKDSGNIFHPQLFVKPFQIMIILKKKTINYYRVARVPLGASTMALGCTRTLSTAGRDTRSV